MFYRHSKNHSVSKFKVLSIGFLKERNTVSLINLFHKAFNNLLLN